MDNTPINQHLKNMSIKPQMLMFPFQAESVAYWVSQMLGLDTSDYSFGYISGWSKDKEVSELKENLDIIKTTADEISQKIENALSERRVQEEAESVSVPRRARSR